VSDDRRIKILTSIVADDIRREISGKEIIIGAYLAKMIVPNVGENAGLVIAISIIVEAREVGSHNIYLRVLGPAQESSTEIMATINVEETFVAHQINAISLSGIPVPLQSEGFLRVQVRQTQSEAWETVRVVQVVKNPDDPALKASPTLASIGRATPSLQPQPADQGSSSEPVPPPRASPARQRRS
jgi:hypothetical protein